MSDKKRSDLLAARRGRRRTGKDIATYPMLINVLQYLTEWSCERPLYKLHWNDNILLLLHDPTTFNAEQLECLKYQQCMPDKDGEECFVMTFAEEII
jgi:hypothetical protein